MKKYILAGLISSLALVGACHAQQSSIDRMKAVIDAVRTNNDSNLTDEQRTAVQSARESAAMSADMTKLSPATVDFAVKQSTDWIQNSREAFVAALPPRDQAIGRSVLLGDRTLSGDDGRLYIFVSRSMPMSLLRAYSVQAMYTGATLVVKGIRKGDTVKEFIEEAVTDFNNADGQLLAGLEINPNLFDMFGVSVVPAVVWTNRIGLDDIGSGCDNFPEGTPLPQVTLEGPNDTLVTVDAPVCAPAPPTSFYKLSGALALPYVLDRFQEAGASKTAMDKVRAQLAEQRNVLTSGQEVDGNAMIPMDGQIKLANLPRTVLLQWQEDMKTLNVKRGPHGPVFDKSIEDDPVYRQELMHKIQDGLN